MDVLVCSTQVPHMRGGLEQLVEGLVGALGVAGHRAEAVRVPAAWDRDRLLDAPAAWRMVPLDADVVIPVSFPAYFARHSHKVVWLAHQHRAAYDGVDQPWSDIGLDDVGLEVQRQLTEWDQRALGEAVARFTISSVVSDRMARFCGLDSEALYHPPPLADRLVPSPPGDLVVSVTRLEANKRPGLMLDGLGASSSGLRAVLAGRGSLADALRRQVEADGLSERVAMPGYVSDDEVVALLDRALAVVYAPYDEDYGYVTLQAFLAAKPVITTADAGGVLEWVSDGETGLVTDGSAEQLGQAIDRLAGDPGLAADLGRAGGERAAALGWPQVVERLLGAGR